MVSCAATGKEQIKDILEHDCYLTTAKKGKFSSFATPAGLKIRMMRTDEGGDFKGRFQEELDKLEIHYELPPPGTPQYIGVAERALGLLKEKSLAILETMGDRYSPKLGQGLRALRVTCRTSVRPQQMKAASHRSAEDAAV